MNMHVWSGLATLFNGISVFVGYLIPKLSLYGSFLI